MNTQQALNTLINAVRLGVKRGAFEIEEVVAISQAIEVFTKPKEGTKEEKPKNSEQPPETKKETKKK